MRSLVESCFKNMRSELFAALLLSDPLHRVFRSFYRSSGLLILRAGNPQCQTPARSRPLHLDVQIPGPAPGPGASCGRRLPVRTRCLQTRPMEVLSLLTSKALLWWPWALPISCPRNFNPFAGAVALGALVVFGRRWPDSNAP